VSEENDKKLPKGDGVDELEKTLAAIEKELKESSEEKDDGVVVVAEEKPESESEEKKPEPKPKTEKREEKATEKKGDRELEPPAFLRNAVKKSDSKEYLPDFPYDFKTVLTVLLAVSVIVFIWCVVFHPSMRIDHIEINGNYEFSDDRILDELGVHVGDHILTPTLVNAMRLERSTPYIQDIDVHISFPSALVINVTERHRLAYIRVPDGYCVIDDEGVILDFCTFDSAVDVHPVLCGLDLNSVVIGQRTDITESLQFRKMILVLGAVLDADRGSIRNDDYSFYDSVREIRVVSSGLIFLTVELPDGTVLQVKLAGVENIDENMQWLLYAIRADAFEGLPAGSLDMTEEEKIYRAYNT
jgi:cell division septal protein FtsQ